MHETLIRLERKLDKLLRLMVQVLKLEGQELEEIENLDTIAEDEVAQLSLITKLDQSARRLQQVVNDNQPE